MPRMLSYADAVRLLGGNDNRVVRALDRLTGGLLLAATGGGASFVLSLFDAKGELARLSDELVSGLGDRLSGLGRFDRTERLDAAYKVIVIGAYFDAVATASLPFGARDLRLDRRLAAGLASGQEPSSARLGAVVAILNETEIPMRVPAGGQAGADPLAGFYGALGAQLLEFVSGLDLWGRLDERSQRRCAVVLREEVPGAAVRRCDEMLSRLALQFPEVAYWTERLDHEATRDEIARLALGMEGLSRALDRITTGQAPDARRESLARHYRAVLRQQIVATGDVPTGLTIPTLAAAYVNPSFRAAQADRFATLDRESWWERLAVSDDLQGFLLRYLTSVQAVEHPLVVLGQPGSGKSVLTRILAARLPPADFMVIRVVLREVPADTDLQGQIEHAIRDATGERLSWPELARSAGGSLPVVLLDGFDELLQATGVSQSDYLESVVRFQEREADHGRPVAVVVTSRTAVADRVRIPVVGVMAVRLEPFDAGQVDRWLGVWNQTNAHHLAQRGLRPLPAEAMLRHEDLGTQPLLLLMLALYDADGNALQREVDELREAELYERLLTSFAKREVQKDDPALHGARLDDAVDQELHRLALAAFAMFNRGRQWVTEAELNVDLAELLGETGPRPVGRDLRAAATPAQLVVGRFFFVHQAQAMRDGGRMTACEFLHATFGEYLVARLVVAELSTLVRQATLAEAGGSRYRRVALDDAFLHAMLSFVPLTARERIPVFLTELLERLPSDQRSVLRGLLISAFHTSMAARRDLTHEAYEPQPLGVPARHAAYSANLLLLAAMLGSPITGRELFPRAVYPVDEWTRHALLWRSELPGAGWERLVDHLRVDRGWDDRVREITLTYEPWDPPEIDMFWSYSRSPRSRLRHYAGWREISALSLRKQGYFVCDHAEALPWHALAPFFEADQGAGQPIVGQGVLSPERTISVGHALLRCWILSSTTTDDATLATAYRECLTVILHARPAEDLMNRDVFLAMVLRQLAADAGRLTPECRSQMFEEYFRDTILTSAYPQEHPQLLAWAREAFGDVGYTEPS